VILGKPRFVIAAGTHEDGSMTTTRGQTNEAEPSPTRGGASSSVATIVTLHPSLVHTRALATAMSELSRFILTVSLSLSATISKAM
jgi:hypothetical protein